MQNRTSISCNLMPRTKHWSFSVWATICWMLTVHFQLNSKDTLKTHWKWKWIHEHVILCGWFCYSNIKCILWHTWAFEKIEWKLHLLVSHKNIRLVLPLSLHHQEVHSYVCGLWLFDRLGKLRCRLPNFPKASKLQGMYCIVQPRFPVQGHSCACESEHWWNMTVGL